MTLPGRLADVPVETLAVNIPYALALAAVALEVAWLARRPGSRRARVLADARTSATMAVGAFAVGLVYTLVLRAEWHQLSRLAPTALTTAWRTKPAVGFVVAFVAWDGAGWAYHFVGHRTRLGWAAHQPHHSGSEYDLTVGLRQSWLPFHGLLYLPLIALLGFDFGVVAVCAAVSNCWQVLEHTSVPVRFPRWFSAAVMTPAAHRWHHGANGEAVNLGPVFTCWDRLAGTWVGVDTPTARARSAPARVSASAVAIELAGWRDLWRQWAGSSPTSTRWPDEPGSPPSVSSVTVTVL